MGPWASVSEYAKWEGVAQNLLNKWQLDLPCFYFTNLLATLCDLWVPSSLIRDRTQALSSERMEPQPPDHQGIPCLIFKDLTSEVNRYSTWRPALGSAANVSLKVIRGQERDWEERSCPLSQYWTFWNSVLGRTLLASNCLGPLVPGSGCNQVEMGWDKKLGEIALSEHSIPGDTRQGPLLHCSSETGNEQRLDSLRSQS